jgi:ribonuclease VapC
MSDAVLDSSAVLALLLAEPGSEVVRAALPGALMSTVNLAEVVAKLCERGMPSNEATAAVQGIGVEFVDFTTDQARICGDLRTLTRSAGLSLGDRACLALARLRGVPAVTADAAWTSVPEIAITLIRKTKSGAARGATPEAAG